MARLLVWMLQRRMFTDLFGKSISYGIIPYLIISVALTLMTTPCKTQQNRTMYEADEKKHYLCVKKGSLVGRYMLQDNTKPAWHSDKRSTPERVQDAVDQMIERLQVEG